MPLPVQINFRGLRRSAALTTHIRSWAERLARFHERLERCEVTVELPHRHQRQGRQFEVRIVLRVPGADLAVNHAPGVAEAHDDPFVAVRDAFLAARRRLEDHVRKIRGDVKTHAREV
jgi:hypothetical protein